MPNSRDERAKTPHTLDEVKIVANEGDILGRFDLVVALGEFRAGALRDRCMLLFYNNSIASSRRLDIARPLDAAGSSTRFFIGG